MIQQPLYHNQNGSYAKCCDLHRETEIEDPVSAFSLYTYDKGAVLYCSEVNETKCFQYLYKANN